MIFPLSTIYLDQTHCTPPNLTTVATPPPPTAPPPPDPSSHICLGLYEAVQQHYTEPFICSYLQDSCDLGITCTLSLFTSIYQMNVSIDTAANPTHYFIFSVASEDGSRLDGVADGLQVSVALPSPAGSSLTFKQSNTAQNIKGFQVYTGEGGGGIEQLIY